MMTIPTPEQDRQRLEAAVEWAQTVYGTPKTEQLRFQVAVPYQVTVDRTFTQGANHVVARETSVPAIQRDGTRVAVHPLIASNKTPRYVRRCLIYLAFIHFSHPDGARLSMKLDLAPDKGKTVAWLTSKGFEDKSWDV